MACEDSVLFLVIGFGLELKIEGFGIVAGKGIKCCMILMGVKARVCGRKVSNFVESDIIEEKLVQGEFIFDVISNH